MHKIRNKVFKLPSVIFKELKRKLQFFLLTLCDKREKSRTEIF